MWDLLASGPRKDAQREAIAEAMGPVWEANHVWLVFVIVLLFTAFPDAFAALSVALFFPWHLVLLGIVLRGAAFVFRAYGPPLGRGPRTWGLVFGVASLVTPFVLGATAGAVASGGLRVAEGEVLPGASSAWLAPEALVFGAITVAAAAYLAAVYLTLETAGELREDFRRRALAAWGALGVVAALGLLVFRATSPHLWAPFATFAALPLVAAETAAGAAVLWALLTRRFPAARALAVVQVAVLVLGWGFVQYPYLVYPDLPLAEAAAPPAVLAFVAWTTPAGLAVLVPSLWFLFKVFKGHRPGVGAS